MAFHRRRNKWPWMTLSSHFVLNRPTVFRVESFSVDALVLRRDCFKIDRDAHTLSTEKMYTVHGLQCGFWRYKIKSLRRCSSGFAGEVVSIKWECSRENASFLFRSLFSHLKFPTGLTYRNLRGFERFPGDSTALVITAALRYALCDNAQICIAVCSAMPLAICTRSDAYRYIIIATKGRISPSPSFNIHESLSA